ncbi:glycosyltransferase family 2 protein [Aureimonas frigidaquae]|uniref:glycosyltransferase family 2 protein n=1 Tax=Aureimonas frigidaquae TaxID=424757 RepID=UPI00078316B8|nr:glycosyltransferase family 2 protein [Aureimonas frigidaquae]
MQPDVSFIIPAWRAADTVGTALTSALAQTGVSVECIVVDDCSGDGTADAARALGDPRVTVLSLPDNRGPAGARNAALEQARGRWIAVLDCDDRLLPDRLHRMIARGEARDAAIVVDNLIVEEAGQGRPMFPTRHLERLDTIALDRFILSNRIFRSRFNYGYMKPILRRDVLERHAIRYPEALRIGEDFLFMASVMAWGGTCVVEPSAGYVYAIRQGSISRVLHPEHVEALIQADEAFQAAHSLSPSARRAMQRHAKSLADAAAFLALVEHLKQGAIGRAFRQAIANPVAFTHLRMPIQVRLQRLTRPRLG